MPPNRPRHLALTLLAAAALLAASAVVVQHRTREVERRFPPRGRLTIVRGVRLHYLDRGPQDAAHTVVMLHGNGTMAEELDLSGIAGLCAERHRVLVFDRPGFGYSERPPGRPWGPDEQADLLLETLRQIGIERPIVLGHSWGTLVALAMALRQPQDVAALVLVSGYYFPTPRLDAIYGSAPALPLVGPLLARTLSPLLGRLAWPLLVRRMFAPLAPTPAFREGYPAWMSLRPTQLEASAAEAAQMVPAAAALRRLHAQLRVPTVLVAGAKDRMLSTRWHSGRFADELEPGWLRIIEGAGHMVHHAAPGQVVAAVEQAIQAVEGRLQAQHQAGLEPADRMPAAAG